MKLFVLLVPDMLLFFESDSHVVPLSFLLPLYLVEQEQDPIQFKRTVLDTRSVPNITAFLAA